MTTLVEDVRTVLAEVAPELSDSIRDGRLPHTLETRPGLSREEFDVLHRAMLMARQRREGIRHRLCVGCSWAIYNKPQTTLAELAAATCEHLP